MKEIILEEVNEKKLRGFLATFYEIEISRVCKVTISPAITEKGVDFKIVLQYEDIFEDLVKASFKDGMMSLELWFFIKD